LHTGQSAGDDPKEEFRRWQNIMIRNTQLKDAGKSLESHLIEFYDDAASGFRAD
jgi:hypothetical protein